MGNDFLRLYAYDSNPDSAYFLEEGKVVFYPTETSRYGISGKNLILGSTEIIMNHYLQKETSRVETAVIPNTSQMKKISAEKFIAGMDNLSFVINTAMVLAKQVKETNAIIRREMANLDGKNQKQREDALQFYHIVIRIADEFSKRKLPWLNDLVKDRTTSILYKKGEAYHKSEEPVTVEPPSSLNSHDIEYAKGALICEEGEAGHDMYILKSGTIDVYIGANKVASIDTPGTVIGEMALLLGDPRSATLRSKNRVVINKVAKSDLKMIAGTDMGMIQSVAIALAKRHFFNIFRISTISQSIAEKNVKAGEEDNTPSGLDKSHLELRNLKNDVEEACSAKNGDFLKDLLDTF